MKRIIAILTVTILLASCSVMKKKDGYSAFYKKYKKDENVVNFGVPTGFVKMFIDRDEKELRKFIKNIDKLRFFIADDSGELLKILHTYIPETLYKDVMVIKDGGDKVMFKARDNEEAITELLMIVEEEEGSFVVMSLKGEFTFDDMKNFVKSVDTKKVVGDNKKE